MCAFLPYRAPSGKVALGRFGLFAAQLGNDPYLRIAAVPKAPELRSAAVVVLLTQQP